MTDAHQLPLLSLMLAAPALGAGLVWVRPQQDWARRVALGAALATLALSLWVLARFDSSIAGLQLVERHAWIPTLNIHYGLGVDGISVLLLPATAILTLAALVASWTWVRTMPRLYFSLMLLLQCLTIGVFVASDTILFFLFWELSLVPIFFLTSLWGVGAGRRFAATKYTLLMLAAGVALLFAFLALAFNHAQVAGGGVPDGLSFDYETLLATPLSGRLELTVFLLLLVGFGVKTPLVPLHTWLPLMAAEDPLAVSALLTGLKLGAYGLIRFLVPLAPHATQGLFWLLAGLGVVAILYGALGALAQTNLRRMLAYSSLSHVGLVVLGVAALDRAGVQGAVFQLVNFALVSGGLFILAAFLHRRTGTTESVGLGGVAQSMPLLAGFFLVLGLASLGLPGTSGFPAELLLILGVFRAHAGAGLAALFGTVLAAAYLLGLYRRAFLGPAAQPAVVELRDLKPRELAVALALTVLVLAGGIYPQWALNLTQASTSAWVARARGPAPAQSLRNPDTAAANSSGRSE